MITRRRLVTTGALAENPSLRAIVWIERGPSISHLPVDQLGATRNPQGPADIGAIEAP